jgi:hypothetical protein
MDGGLKNAPPKTQTKVPKKHEQCLNTKPKTLCRAAKRPFIHTCDQAKEDHLTVTMMEGSDDDGAQGRQSFEQQSAQCELLFFCI